MGQSKGKTETAASLTPFAQGYILFSVFLLGLAVLVLEVLGTRVISPYYGSSVYVWSSLITVTLASLAVGYWAGGSWADRNPSPALYFAQTAVSGLLVLAVPFVKNMALSATTPLGLGIGSLVCSALLFAPALVVMSATGPLAIRLTISQFPLIGRGVGKVYAISTVGSVLGALLTGFVLVPHFAVRQVLSALGLGLMLLGGLGLILWGRRGGAGGIVCLAVLAMAHPFLRPPRAAASNILVNRSSFYGEIKVLDSQALRFLLIDGVSHGCINTQLQEPWADVLLFFEYLPLLKPESRKALLIGLGAGSVSESYRRHHGIVTDAVEIDPVIVEVARSHFGFVPSGRVAVEDGRTFVERTADAYDIAILDAFTSERVPFHLFTEEFFEKIRSRLLPGGFFGINTVGAPDHPGWTSIYKTLARVFGHVRVFASQSKPGELGNIIFVASNAPFPKDVDVSPLRPFAREIVKKVLSNELPSPEPEILNAMPVLTDDFNPIDDYYKDIVMRWREAIIRASKDVLLFEGAL